MLTLKRAVHALAIPSPGAAGNAVDAPRAVVIGGVVHFQGRISFTGESSWFEVPLPEDLRPDFGQPMWNLRGSSAPYLIVATVYDNGGTPTLGFQYADLSAIKAGDDVDLCGSYVVAD